MFHYYIQYFDQTISHSSSEPLYYRSVPQIIQSYLEIPSQMIQNLKLCSLSGMPLTIKSQIPQFIRIEYKLLGGKGGFGANMKNLGKRISRRQITNFDSCRDLSGRRLRTLEQAKLLAESETLKEKEEKERKEKREKEIKEGLLVVEKKVLFDDASFWEEKDKSIESVIRAVQAGSKQSVVQSSSSQSISTSSDNGKRKEPSTVTFDYISDSDEESQSPVEEQPEHKKRKVNE